jgi:hypothetical protein
MNDVTRFKKLTEDMQGEYIITDLNKTKKDIIFLCGFMVKVNAHIAFCAGRMLTAVKATCEHGKFMSWIDKEFPLSQRTARKYMLFYERMKVARCATLDNISMTEALQQAGIIERKEPERLQFESYGGEPEQPELPWERYFELPPLDPKVKLKNHRFEIPNSHEIYMIQRGFNYPLKIAEILTPENRDLKSAHRGMLEGVQAVLERYFQEVERIEALRGITK